MNDWLSLETAWLGLITAVITVGYGITSRRRKKQTSTLTEWSRRQDTAIKAVQNRLSNAERRIIRLLKSNATIKTYTRRLLDILRTNGIDHPNPPDEFFSDDTYIPEMEKHND